MAQARQVMYTKEKLLRAFNLRIYIFMDFTSIIGSLNQTYSMFITPEKVLMS